MYTHAHAKRSYSFGERVCSLSTGIQMPFVITRQSADNLGSTHFSKVKGVKNKSLDWTLLSFDDNSPDEMVGK